MGRDDFSSEYVSSTSTSDVHSKVKQASEPEIDLSKYEIGKPRRVLIRAKVTHGDSGNS